MPMAEDTKDLDIWYREAPRELIASLLELIDRVPRLRQSSAMMICRDKLLQAKLSRTE